MKKPGAEPGFSIALRREVVLRTHSFSVSRILSFALPIVFSTLPAT
jgi:hypothetical protein